MSSANAPPLFRCPRQAMTLTAAGCARLWSSAQAKKPAPYEGRAHCFTCPIGARHAGKPEAALFEPVQELKAYCPRCRRVAGRLINGRWCISCYNRQREAEKGRNAKGGVPKLAHRVHAIRVAMVAADAAAIVRELPAVTSMAEAMLYLAQQAKGPVQFGVAPLA